MLFVDRFCMEHVLYERVGKWCVIKSKVFLKKGLTVATLATVQYRVERVDLQIQQQLRSAWKPSCNSDAQQHIWRFGCM